MNNNWNWKKYRKRPVTIRAFQLDSEGDSMIIDTLEGQMKANPGDWLIEGIKGELYPCRDDIFQATYEAIDPKRKPWIQVAKEYLADMSDAKIARRSHYIESDDRPALRLRAVTEKALDLLEQVAPTIRAQRMAFLEHGIDDSTAEQWLKELYGDE